MNLTLTDFLKSLNLHPKGHQAPQRQRRMLRTMIFDVQLIFNVIPKFDITSEKLFLTKTYVIEASLCQTMKFESPNSKMKLTLTDFLKSLNLHAKGHQAPQRQRRVLRTMIFDEQLIFNVIVKFDITSEKLFLTKDLRN